MAHELHLKQAFETLEQLESLGRERKQRTALLMSAKDNPILKKMFQLCYDWLIDWDFYYYEPEIKIVGNGKTDNNWNAFLTLIEHLRNDALGFIKHSELAVEFMSVCSQLEQKWYSRILNKDLSVGVSWAILNNIWEDMIPYWGLATANTIQTIDSLEYPICAQPIVEGIRSGIVVQNGLTTVYTDNFRKYPALKFIGQNLKSEKQQGAIDGIISSQYLHYLNYKVKSITQEVFNELCNNLSFIATDYFSFDVLYWTKGHEDKTPFTHRIKKLEQIINPNSTSIKLNPITLVTTKKELSELYKSSDLGLILKAPSSTYINDLNSNWFIWNRTNN